MYVLEYVFFCYSHSPWAQLSHKSHPSIFGKHVFIIWSFSLSPKGVGDDRADRHPGLGGRVLAAGGADVDQSTVDRSCGLSGYGSKKIKKSKKGKKYPKIASWILLVLLARSKGEQKHRNGFVRVHILFWERPMWPRSLWFFWMKPEAQIVAQDCAD